MATWTVDKVKEELPPVKVKYNGEILEGKILGRRLPFPRVVVKGQNYDLSAEFAWHTIVHCLNEDKPLIF